MSITGVWGLKNTYAVSIQWHKQIHHLLEEVGHFFLRLIIGVALGIERIDTSTVLVPLVLPEALVVTTFIFPVDVHIGEKISLAVRLQDLGNIRELAGRVAKLVIGSITVVRPIGVSVIVVLGQRCGLTITHESSNGQQARYLDWSPRTGFEVGSLQDS